MSDQNAQKINKSVKIPFYGSQELPKPHSVSSPNLDLKTGKSRPTHPDES